MNPPRINISRAALVTIQINDYDQIPLTLAYNTTDVPAVPIDIRGYLFSFDLKQGGKEDPIVEYKLGPDDPSEFLSVTGDDNNVLNMQLMWEDIRDNHVTWPGTYRVIQQVTDTDGNIFVNVIYTVNAARD